MLAAPLVWLLEHEENEFPTAWQLGFGFRVWGLRFRVWGLGLRVWGLGFRV